MHGRQCVSAMQSPVSSAFMMKKLDSVFLFVACVDLVACFASCKAWLRVLHQSFPWKQYSIGLGVSMLLSDLFALRRSAAALIAMGKHLLRYENSVRWRWAAELVRGCPSLALYRVPDEILQEVVFFGKRIVPKRQKRLLARFENGMGTALRPWIGVVGGLKPFTLGRVTENACAGAIRAQKEAFDYEPHGLEAPSKQFASMFVSVASDGLPGSVEEAGLVEWAWVRETPRDYVAKLLGEMRNDPDTPMVFNDAQLGFLALVVAQLEKIVDAAKQGSVPQQEVMLLLGQGGVGKSELLKVVKAVTLHCFGVDSYIAMASSNTAARGIGGFSIHRTLGISPKMNRLEPRCLNGVSRVMMDRWEPVRVLAMDDVSLCGPDLFYAASYRACVLRTRGDKTRAGMPGYAFGGIPLIVMTGDFFRLSPIVKIKGLPCHLSLLRAGSGSISPEFQLGLRCFKEIVTSVVELKTTYRFRDEVTKETCEVLPKLFDYMRCPKGESMPSFLYDALMSRVVLVGDVRMQERRMREGYEMASSWEAVARLMQYRARRDAAAASQMLMYIQAVDTPSVQLTDTQWIRLLSEVSMTTTGNRMAFLPLFCGMRVRLMAALSYGHKLERDAVGTVVDVEFHPGEFQDYWADWRHNLDHPAWARGYAYLNRMAMSVHVCFDGYSDDHGLGPGVVAVQPSSETWVLNVNDVDAEGGWTRQRNVRVGRCQVPLAPDRVRMVPTLREVSMGALIVMLDQNWYFDSDDWWLHVYACLSRVRHIDSLLLYGLPERGLFERGPPRWLRERLDEFQPCMQTTALRGVSLLRSFDYFRDY